MKQFKVSVAALVLAIAGIACGDAGANGAAAAKEETAAQVSVSRDALADARRVASRYGRAHLGHFLEFSARDLRMDDLQVPADVSIDVSTTHTSYCIRVTNRALPSIHPWRVGTLSSWDGEDSSADRCRK